MATDQQFLVVGIGASAGGLRALEDFFKAMPANPGMAFIVVTHLAPDRESFLPDILERHTGLTVELARDGQRVEPNSVYVLPPNATLTMAGGLLRLATNDAGGNERRPVDVFFASIAQDCGEYAVGVVLSGSGSDGVLGIRQSRNMAGWCLPSQPMVLVRVLPGCRIARLRAASWISRCRSRRCLKSWSGTREAWTRSTRSLERGVRPRAIALPPMRGRRFTPILRTLTGHDFSGYKLRTFFRRVHRRMQINHCENLTDYAALLSTKPDEATLLFRDLLINVTSFFRDTEAFDALETMVVPKLFDGRGASDTVRVWIPGCSTGEEAISIAILLREHMDIIACVTPRDGFRHRRRRTRACCRPRRHLSRRAAGRRVAGAPTAFFRPL